VEPYILKNGFDKLELCKQLIHPAIKIPYIENVSTLDEL